MDGNEAEARSHAAAWVEIKKRMSAASKCGVPFRVLSLKLVLQPSASLANLLEMHTLGSYLKPIESEILGMEPSNLCFNKF